MSEQKHDGNLLYGYHVAFHEDEIEIRDGKAEYVGLSPEQALLLLNWLLQEKARLEEMQEKERADAANNFYEYSDGYPE